MSDKITFLKWLPIIMSKITKELKNAY
jgi:hypothetical protein